MKLLEVEGKQLFRRAGIRIPHAVLIQSSKDFKKIFAPSIIKAQVLSGKRGKSGLIKKAKTRAEEQEKPGSKWRQYRESLFSF